MNNKQLKALMRKLGACEEAREWVSSLPNTTTLNEAWEKCERAEWMLWLVGKMADKPNWPTRKDVILAACACAETALKYVPKGELRPGKCIETVRRYVRGEATLEELVGARRAAAAAYAAAAAAYAAADAAAAAADAYAAADAAAYAAAYAAADAYAADAMKIKILKYGLKLITKNGGTK